MNLTKLALDRNRVTLVLAAAVIAGGVMAYFNMSRAEDPGFPVRTAVVLTYFPGASPDRVERLVTDEIEKVVQEIPEVDSIVTESRQGLSVVFVNLLPGVDDLRPVWDNLRRKVGKARRDLPEAARPPIVDDEFGDVYGVLMTLTGPEWEYRELEDIAQDIRNEILLLEDVAKAEIRGAQEERVFIQFDTERLATLDVHPLQLMALLESTNILISGGAIRVGADRIVLEPTGNYETLADLRKTVIPIPETEEVLYLEDVASVSRGYVDPPASKVRVTGQPALVLAVSMREGGNILRLGRQVKDLRRRIEGNLPIGLELDFVAFQPQRVREIVDGLNLNLLEAVVIIIAVMLLFLGLRTGFIVALGIPMTVVMTYMFMGVFQVGMDQVSIAAIIIALGMLVDNAIVVSESILVQVREGKTPYDAAVATAREFWGALLTASLGTCAAFLPIALAESETGEYTAPLFYVVSICLLSSWVVAMTLTPLLCVWLVRPGRQREDGKQQGGYESWIYRAYRRALLAMLRFKYVTAGAAFLAFFASLVLFRFLPVIFFPPSDRAEFRAELELPNGTAIERTEEVAIALEAFLEREQVALDSGEEGVTAWAAFIGRGLPRFVLPYAPTMPRPEYAEFLVNVTDYRIIDGLMDRMDAYAMQRFPELDLTLQRVPLGPPVKAPVEIRISGRQTDKLFRIVEDVKEKLRETEGARQIEDDWGAWAKKILVKVDQPRARRAGLSSQDVALSLLTTLSGYELGQYRKGDDLIPIILRSEEAEDMDLAKLRTLSVYSSQTGQSVPLLQLADTEVAWQPARIKRRDRLRTVTVSAYLEPGYTAEQVNAPMVAWLEQHAPGWGYGYRWGLGGEAEESNKANRSIAEKLPVAAFIVLVLLVVKFNSIRRVLITMLTFPLSIIGVTIGLFVTQSYFGFMTLLGIISLAGIVTNNAIVLLERIATERNVNGYDPPTAIIEAAQRRLRPIMLTSVTTIFGLLPLWLLSTPMWPPMAIAIIFGLLVGTVLTLGVAPCLYAIFFRVKYPRGWRFEGTGAKS